MKHPDWHKSAGGITTDISPTTGIALCGPGAELVQMSRGTGGTKKCDTGCRAGIGSYGNPPADLCQSGCLIVGLQAWGHVHVKRCELVVQTWHAGA